MRKSILETFYGLPFIIQDYIARSLTDEVYKNEWDGKDIVKVYYSANRNERKKQKLEKFWKIVEEHEKEHKDDKFHDFDEHEMVWGGQEWHEWIDANPHLKQRLKG